MYTDCGLGLSDIPVHLLHAELLRRQQDNDGRPKCETKGGKGHYNTPIHVFALFLILILSTAGTHTAIHAFQCRTDDRSLLLPNCRQALSLDTSSPPIPLRIETLRHRRSHSNSLRPSPADRLPVPQRPMPPSLLERWLSGYARLHSHDGGLRGSRR
jgi:hypothetical protein